jgi:hypothetical protein
MLFHRWSQFSQAISFAFYFFQPNKLGLGEPTQGLSPATDGSNLSPSPHPHPSLSSPHEIPLPPVPAAPLADATGEHPAACRHTQWRTQGPCCPGSCPGLLANNYLKPLVDCGDLTILITFMCVYAQA